MASSEDKIKAEHDRNQLSSYMKLNFVRPKSVNLRHYKAIRERMFPSEKQADRPNGEETSILIAKETIKNRKLV